MNKITPLVKKEVRSYFNSPIAYVVIIFFLFFTAGWLFFIEQFFAADYASLRAYFNTFPLLLVLLIPAVTMRSWAEERRSRTDELLLTLPVRETDLVIGKFAAAFVLLIIILIFTLPVPFSLLPLGDFSIGEIAGQYAGSILLSAAGLSIGLCVSSLSKNQISSFLSSLFLLLLLTISWRLTMFSGLPPAVSAFFRYVSLQYHFQSFTRGIIDTRDVAFFILVTWAGLYLNVKIIAARRWR